MKLILDIKDNISPSIALSYVSYVVNEGRISEAAGIKHYCWASIFPNGIIVAARRKRSEKAADSFVIYKKGHEV